MAKDYYKILGVGKSAGKEDIKKAFRKLAHKHHPDKGGGDDAKFKEVTEAYAVLSDDKKRREYDAYGQAFAGGGPSGPSTGGGAAGFGGPFNGFDFSQFQRDFGGEGMEFDFGDIFGDIFSGRRGSGSPRAKSRGRDISIDLEIPFKDAIYGTKRSVLIAKVTTCEVCSGSGAKPGTELETCKTCNGSGRIHEVRNSILGQFTSVRTCEACGGHGKIPKEKCASCRGQGVTRKEQEIQVSIPAGIDHGEMIRLPQQGEAVKGGVAGDLYVKVHVKPHLLFRREGANLVMRLPLKLTDALLGTSVTLETLEGKTLEVTVPPMKRAEEMLRIRGKGVPAGSPRGNAGDLIIELEAAFPKTLSARAKQAVEDLKKEGL